MTSPKNPAQKFSVKLHQVRPELANCSDLLAPRFSTILKGGSFRTIDPVTTPRRNYLQHGSFLCLSGA